MVDLAPPKQEGGKPMSFLLILVEIVIGVLFLNYSFYKSIKMEISPTLLLIPMLLSGHPGV